ncbi:MULTISPECIES: hypothetical protein [Myxococcaceae]|uniref:hypothetical protein n=1 Tax=Myxococcaceae TaxID=31 RepID=UPI001890AE5C|nr:MULTISPECIES: hypothetical protein [Myxococcaceae]MBF5044321.1 hypothetical protein [Simulacricoccus sp. 17bor-14]
MRMARARGAVWLMAALAAAAAGCGGGGDDGGGGGGGGEAPVRPGLGASTAAPRGSALVLPAGVSVQSPFPGAQDAFCDTDDPEQFGLGADVSVCLPVGHAKDTDDVLELPCGTVLVSQTQAVQNGLLLQRVLLPLAAASQRTFPLWAFCANKLRTPSSPSARYVLGPVTDDPDVLELCRLLEDKEVEQERGRVQEALWHITEGSGLSSADRTLLSELPTR